MPCLLNNNCLVLLSLDGNFSYKIPFTKTWLIVVGICDFFSPLVTTCVINQGCEYWLRLDVLTSAIKLYVQLGKENLELQEKIDVAQELDMCMKFKQLGVNMQEQVNLVFNPSLISLIFSNLLKLTTYLV